MMMSTVWIPCAYYAICMKRRESDEPEEDSELYEEFIEIDYEEKEK